MDKIIHPKIEEDDGPPQLTEEEPLCPEALAEKPDIDDTRTLRYRDYTLGVDKFLFVKKDPDGYEHVEDENGEEVEVFEEPKQLKAIKFDFLDPLNIVCGLCGVIVYYEDFVNGHLRNDHPDIFASEEPYSISSLETWLREKINLEKRSFDIKFRSSMIWDEVLPTKKKPVVRKVSSIRVNPCEMNLKDLDKALRAKVAEKLGVKFPVTLLDKQHVKCGMCNAVISINRKFEIVHIVRHINAWHSIGHPCAGKWLTHEPEEELPRPFSMQDFILIQTNTQKPPQIQCTWCQVIMNRATMANHFANSHPGEVTLPNCALCIKEIYINALFLVKYGDNFDVKALDDRMFKCEKFNKIYSSEATLEKSICASVTKININLRETNGEVEILDDGNVPFSHSVMNSKANLGRNCKPKRTFIAPAYRQAIPENSNYVEAVTECHWKCKLCGGNIFGAVISAGAIIHYKQFHPSEIQRMQYELCRARLNRISGGFMKFIHPQLVECQLCCHAYHLHKPYNICRGVRHLKLKHPSLMPENSPTNNNMAHFKQESVTLGELIEDPDIIASFEQQYNVTCEKIQTVYYGSVEPIYIMHEANEKVDIKTAQEIIKAINNDNVSSDEAMVVKLEIDINNEALNFEQKSCKVEDLKQIVPKEERMEIDDNNSTDLT